MEVEPEEIEEGEEILLDLTLSAEALATVRSSEYDRRHERAVFPGVPGGPGVPLTGAAGPLASKTNPLREEDDTHPDDYARFYVTFDDVEAHIGEKQQELLRAARYFSRQIENQNHERCMQDWLYCMFYNYARTGMDSEVAPIIEFITSKYALPAVERHGERGEMGERGERGERGESGESGKRGGDSAASRTTGLTNPISLPRRRFVAQTLHYVLHSQNLFAKQFMVLMLLAREPELQQSMRQACPDRHIEDLLARLPQLAEMVTNVPFNRINVAFYIAQFLRCTKDAYFKGLRASPAMANLQRSGKMHIDGMGL